MDNNIFTQIGLVVLVGLACKNAILIAEYAKQQMDAGMERQEAAVEASRLRLRPILRQALGTAVLSGMLGVTFFGIFLLRCSFRSS
jgi:multidrug efflux pump subunit AcrB